MSYDYTFCANGDCKLRETCWRYNLEIVKEERPHSMAEFTPNNSGTCDYYIPRRRK
jgi:hypothetical protein